MNCLKRKFNKELNLYIDKIIDYVINRIVDEKIDINYNNIDFYLSMFIDDFMKNDELNKIFNNKFKNNNMYSLSYEPDENNKYPIAQCEKKLIYINQKSGNKELSCGNFKLLPDLNNERDCIYISAPSRAGKTYFAMEYIKKYKQIFPLNKIYLFSIKKNDKSIDKVEPIKIKILPDENNDENSILEDLNEIKYYDFKNSLVIFDDIENISFSKKINNKLMKLSNEILNLGGQDKISIIMISHVMMNYKITKNIINECNKIVMFPHSGIYAQYYNYLKEYMKYGKNIIEHILNSENSRWVILSKQSPNYIITQKKIEILK